MRGLVNSGEGDLGSLGDLNVVHDPKFSHSCCNHSEPDHTGPDPTSAEVAPSCAGKSSHHDHSSTHDDHQHHREHQDKRASDTLDVVCCSHEQHLSPSHRNRLFIAALLTAVGCGAEALDAASEETLLPLFITAIVLSAPPLLPRAWQSLRVLSPDICLLMTITVIGSIILGEWSEGASLVILFAIAEWLEGFTVHRARRAIGSVLSLAPDTAFVQRGMALQEVAVADVQLNEVVSVRPGSRIPLDGFVLSGASHVDQAPVTGESLPVWKQSGDLVYAGSLNGDAHLEIKVSKLYQESTLARIATLVAKAQESKADAQRLIDSFARKYTPTVILLALASAILMPFLLGVTWSDSIYRALTLLVIACPCALVISTPVSICAALTALARHGVVLKGGQFLERLGLIKNLVFDKTGTLTRGEPEVLSVLPLTDFTEQQVLAVAAAIDIHSTHPIARALVREAKARNIKISPSEKHQTLRGQGAQSTIDGQLYFVGNHHLIHTMGLCSEELEDLLSAREALAQTAIIVGRLPIGSTQLFSTDSTSERHGGELLGIISLADQIRSDSPSLIKYLRQIGFRSITMLSGDNQTTAKVIAKSVGIEHAYGDLFPEDKVDKLRALSAQFGPAAMIGDGVNDAPALAAADVGIAMGSGATDVALETASVVLMHDDLHLIVDAILHSRRTIRVIYLNIAFAILIKVIFVVFTFWGATSLWLALFADMGTTLLVIAHSLCLLRLRQPIAVTGELSKS